MLSGAILMLSTIKKGTAKVHLAINKVLAFVALMSLSAVALAAGGGGGGGVAASDFGAGQSQTRYGAGADLRSLSTNATDSFEMIWIVVCSAATLVGLFLAFGGFMRLKKAQDQSSGVTPGSGWWMIGIGAALVVLPWVLFTGANSLTGAGGTP